MARASLCVAQNVPTYLSSLQKTASKICQENRCEYTKAIYLHWGKQVVLLEPKTILSFFGTLCQLLKR